MSFDNFMFYSNYSKNLSEQERSDTIKHMQENFNDMMANGYIDDFEFKIGTNEAESILLNFKTEIPAILTHERMKEKVYNSISLGIQTYHNALKTGDYITQQFKYSPQSPIRNYIVRSLPQIKRTHDYSFILVCQYNLNILDKNNNVVSYPIYFEDNKSRLMEKEYSMALKDNSTYQFVIQDNKDTRRLQNGIVRIMIDDDFYEIVSVDRVSMKGLAYVNVKNSQKDEGNDNLELKVADYWKFVDKGNYIPPRVDIAGSHYIYLDKSEKYTVSSNNVVWKITENENCCELITIDKNNCLVKVVNKAKNIGKIITLTAVFNGTTVNKEILIKGF